MTFGVMLLVCSGTAIRSRLMSVVCTTLSFYFLLLWRLCLLCLFIITIYFIYFLVVNDKYIFEFTVFVLDISLLLRILVVMLRQHPTENTGGS